MLVKKNFFPFWGAIQNGPTVFLKNEIFLSPKINQKRKKPHQPSHLHFICNKLRGKSLTFNLRVREIKAIISIENYLEWLYQRSESKIQAISGLVLSDAKLGKGSGRTVHQAPSSGAMQMSVPICEMSVSLNLR